MMCMCWEEALSGVSVLLKPQPGFAAQAHLHGAGVVMDRWEGAGWEWASEEGKGTG